MVLAIGGNAIGGNTRTFDSQYYTIRDSLKEIMGLVKKGYKIVITHGNGPQVGDALLRNEVASDSVPALPIYACVAGTQGVLGAMIQIALLDILGIDYNVASLITKVTVSAKDSAFKYPKKPIGPTLKKIETQKIKKGEPSASFIEDTPGKYRRIVPSPEPISILELGAIKKLIEDNYIVIACGGGGIPITNENKINFTEAVIDKDLTSEILATGIGASMLVYLTDVSGAYINFKNKNKKMIKRIKVNKIKELLKDGIFEEGSMEPKIRSAIRFVENTGNTAVIASFQKIRDSIDLNTGTIIYK